MENWLLPLVMSRSSVRIGSSALFCALLRGLVLRGVSGGVVDNSQMRHLDSLRTLGVLCFGASMKVGQLQLQLQAGNSDLSIHSYPAI